MVNKKHNAIKLANTIDLSNLDNIIVTCGGLSQLDRDVLVKTFKTINSEFKVRVDNQTGAHLIINKPTEE